MRGRDGSWPGTPSDPAGWEGRDRWIQGNSKEERKIRTVMQGRERRSEVQAGEREKKVRSSSLIPSACKNSTYDL